MPKAFSGQGATGRRAENAFDKGSRLDLFRFVPFRLNRLAAEVSAALSGEYQERYGLDIPEWRVLATLGFRNDACSAQYIAHCTRTHKSTISRAVTALMKRQLVERVENEDDRREFVLRMTRKGKARPLCVSDSVYDPRAPIVKYGHTWKRGGFTCHSKRKGLKCSNRAGHGFFLSRERWSVH